MRESEKIVQLGESAYSFLKEQIINIGIVDELCPVTGDMKKFPMTKREEYLIKVALGCYRDRLGN